MPKLDRAGDPLIDSPSIMNGAGAANPFEANVAGFSRRVSLTRPEACMNSSHTAPHYANRFEPTVDRQLDPGAPTAMSPISSVASTGPSQANEWPNMSPGRKW